MAISSAELSTNLDGVLDSVLETGIPVEVEHKGMKVRIVLAKKARDIDSLVERPGYLNVDPEEVVHMDWSAFWKP